MIRNVFPGAKVIELNEWGYPMGRSRSPVDPDLALLGVTHITGNADLPSAEAEATWRRTDPNPQNSATFFVNRDGSVVQCLDPVTMDPWANGDIRNSDLSNPRIARIARDGINPNRRTFIAIENVGYEPGYTITGAQEKANAAIYRWGTALSGIPISRETIVGHYQINSVTRPNCPGVNKALLDRIVALAAPEEDMILLPVQTYPGGTRAGFAEKTTYDFYRIVNGVVERKRWTTTGATSALALARMALNGDTEHAGILIGNGIHEGWICSGWGAEPTISIPEPTDAAELQAAQKKITEQAASFAALQEQAASDLEGLSMRAADSANRIRTKKP